MRYKRIIAAASALAMLSGCGSNSSSSSKKEATTEPTQATLTETTAASTTTTAAVTTEPTTETTVTTTEDVPPSYKQDPETPAIEGYNLLWSDEFNGEELDLSLWNREWREPGWTNKELQEYTQLSNNSFVRDGNLVIKAIKSQKNGEDYYTSGKLTGKKKTDFTYGKVVARAKVPQGQGFWPAIWMMPKDESYYGQWPKCGEIDIMEVLGSAVDIAYGTIHYGNPYASQQGTYTLTNGTTYASDFHDYSIEWEPGEIRWYVDDELYFTANDWFTAEEGADEKPYPAPFDQPFFLQLNLAVGGTWPGDPDETTDFTNAEFLIDYVRVYQKPEYNTDVKRPEKVFRKPLMDGNLIYNGNFAEDESLTDDVNWKFLLFEGGKGTAEIKDKTIVITSEAEGTEDYSVQLVQPDLPMYKGHKYRVTFDAWSDQERDIKVCVSAPTAGWIRYLKDTSLMLTPEKKTYTYEFEMRNNDDNKGRLEFNMGNQYSTATVYISNVRVEEIK